MASCAFTVLPWQHASLLGAPTVRLSHVGGSHMRDPPKFATGFPSRDSPQWAGRMVAALAAARASMRLSGGRRRQTRSLASSSVARCAHGDCTDVPADCFVRVLCASVQYVGEYGAVVGLQQVNNTDAPHHWLDFPVEIPLLLDAMQADAFQAATFGMPEFLHELEDPLDSLALCETCLRLDAEAGAVGELMIAVDSGESMKCTDDGILHPLDSVTHKRSISVSVSDALAIAMRFSLPLLLDARIVLKAGLSCLDRARLERMLCRDSDEECDVELMMLRDKLADGVASSWSPSSSAVASLLEDLKPFVWYWAALLHTGPGDRDSPHRALRHYQEKYQRLIERQGISSSEDCCK